MAYRTPMERQRMSSQHAGTSMGQLEGGEGDAYNEEGPPSPPGEDEKMGGGETATIPMALLGGKEFKPGEEIVFKLVSMDPQAGTATIAYATGEGDEHEGGMMEEHPAVAGMPE